MQSPPGLKTLLKNGLFAGRQSGASTVLVPGTGKSARKIKLEGCSARLKSCPDAGHPFQCKRVNRKWTARNLMWMVLLAAWVCPAYTQTFKGCECGKNPPGRPAERSMKPYAQEPEDMQPFSKFTKPYYQHYVDLVEYNGAARDIPVMKANDVDEVRIGFIGPLEDQPDAGLGKRMLNGAQMGLTRPMRRAVMAAGRSS